MRISKGWLEDVKRVPSPNFNSRPNGTEIDAIVVHSISLPPEQFGGEEIELFFQNRLDWDAHPYFAKIKGLEVSAHLLVKRNGECVQFVSFDDRAWHAGNSCLQGRDACNDFAIGIELEGADNIPYQPQQYQTLAEVSKCLKEHYHLISDDRIVGHSDVSPGRKTDPGPAFDWSKFRSMLSATTSKSA